MREKIELYNWEIKVGTTHLIDDSGATTVQQSMRVEEYSTLLVVLLVQVLQLLTQPANQTGGALGQFYPDLGIILLNGTSMDDVGGLPTGRSTNGLITIQKNSTTNL